MGNKEYKDRLEKCENEIAILKEITRRNEFDYSGILVKYGRTVRRTLEELVIEEIDKRLEEFIGKITERVIEKLIIGGEVTVNDKENKDGKTKGA